MSVLKTLLCAFRTLLSAGILVGCASAPDAPSLENTKLAYDAHRANFKAANPYTSHTIARPDSHKIVAREFGAQNKGKGLSYVLMHGFPDNQQLYDLLVPELSKAHHVVSFDFLGWGESDKPKSHNYQVSSQRVDLDAVLLALDLRKVAIVVHDLSGQVGIDWALDNEAKISELVLLNSYYNPMPTLVAPDAIEFYSRPGVLRDIARWGANKSEARFKSGLANQLYAFMSNPAARAQFVPVLAHSAPDIRPAFFSSVDVLWQELEARTKEEPRMKAFTKPVRIVFGSDDPFLNSGVATSFAALFPNSCLELIAKANHYVQLDQPQAVAVSMLTRHRAGGKCTTQ